MKILHTESSLGWGGQELRTALEVSLFSREEYDIGAVVSPLSQFRERSGISEDKLIFAPIHKKSLIGLFSAVSILLKQKPDVMVTHSSTDSWLFTIARWLLRYECRLIRMRHVRADVGSGFLTRWLYRQPDVIVTTSSDIKNYLRKMFSGPADRYCCVSTGVDTQRFSLVAREESVALRSQIGVSQSEKIALMVSTLRSWKGHEYAIRALSELENWKLFIVGDGPQEEYLRQLVCNLDLSNQVVFLGFKAHVEPFFHIADVFLQPSLRHEGISQSLLQAGSVGLPVIASDIGGLNEVIEHEKTGLLIPAGSVECLIEAIRMYNTRQLNLAHMGYSLSCAVRSEFSQEVMFKKMEAIYSNRS